MQAVNEVIYLSAEQYDELMSNGTITIEGVVNPINPNAIYIAPSNNIYRYSIKINISVVSTPITVSFDVYSQNANLFPTSNTIAKNYAVLYAIFSGEEKVVAYSDSNNNSGTVSMNFVSSDSFTLKGIVINTTNLVSVIVNDTIAPSTQVNSITFNKQ